MIHHLKTTTIYDTTTCITTNKQITATWNNFLTKTYADCCWWCWFVCCYNFYDLFCFVSWMMNIFCYVFFDIFIISTIWSLWCGYSTGYFLYKQISTIRHFGCYTHDNKNYKQKIWKKMWRSKIRATSTEFLELKKL